MILLDFGWLCLILLDVACLCLIWLDSIWLDLAWLISLLPLFYSLLRSIKEIRPQIPQNTAYHPRKKWLRKSNKPENSDILQTQKLLAFYKCHEAHQEFSWTTKSTLLTRKITWISKSPETNNNGFNQVIQISNPYSLLDANHSISRSHVTQQHHLGLHVR